MTRQEQWREMLARSFQPKLWFEDGESPEAGDWKETFMWVYRRTESGLWTVGWWSPSREWNPDSDYSSKEEAAARVHYLNGGAGSAEVAAAAKEGYGGLFGKRKV